MCIRDRYFFSLFEQHEVSRGLVPSCILYEDVLAVICSSEIGQSYGGWWRRPHDFWDASLAPNCVFMFSSYEMIMEAKNWLEKHLFISILIQEGGALRWSNEKSSEPLSSFHLTTRFHCILLPCIVDVCTFTGSTTLRVLYILG